MLANLQLVEPAIIPDVFCSGMAAAEDLGDGNIRFTLYVNQKAYSSADKHVEHVIVARFIMPLCAVQEGIQLTLKAITAAAYEEKLRLAH